MKPISMALSAALFLATVVTNAGAVECAEGVHRAGCVEKKGPVVVDKPVHEAAAPKAVVVEPPKVEKAPRPPSKKIAEWSTAGVCAASIS
jgi:hypothetical protein